MIGDFSVTRNCFRDHINHPGINRAAGRHITWLDFDLFWLNHLGELEDEKSCLEPSSISVSDISVRSRFAASICSFNFLNWVC